MRWEELFADLEARFAAAAADELNAEVADRIRSEAARVGAAERLAVAVGSTVRVVALGGASASGTVRRSGPDWLLLAESYGADVLVLLSAVAAVTGVPRGVARPGGGGAVGARLGLGSALRAIARDRLPVVLDLVDGTTSGGTVERVGRDHLELTDTVTRGSAAGTVLVPTAAVAMIRRR
jgi:hypothetical protein